MIIRVEFNSVSRRTVFFVSDQTGVTAETMGHSLLTQFEDEEFRQITLPFVSTVDKAHDAVRRINLAASEAGLRPIVFGTLVQEDVREVVKQSNALFLDFFDAFVGPIERELQVRSTHRAGRAHGMGDQSGTPRASTRRISRLRTTMARRATTRAQT
jgi:[pyruvate, water dikinase]-phosphate phosphotransferase / [pyruvate, water dikinase] kinase